jgi:outer membrane protein assembly factor BamA
MIAKTLAAAAGLVALAAPALAQTYTLDRYEITGLTSVPSQPLVAQLKDQPGAKVTTNDIIGDRDQFMSLLQKQYVTGQVKAALRTTGKHVVVIFTVADTGIQKPKVVTVAPKLKEEVFVGNKQIDNDTLLTASGLTRGEEMSDQKIADAQKAIGEYYKKKDIGVSVNGAVQQDSDGTVTVTWTIKEAKKKVKRNTEDEGFKTE